jgi:predicted dehydrogenase
LIRVAILGCDSSHTEAYGELLNLSGESFGQTAKVEWLWGEDYDQSLSKASLLQIPHVTKSPEEAIKNADLVLVIGRYGDSHVAPAKLAISYGKPTYIDKPLTNSLTDAIDLAELARSCKNHKVMSFSPYRFSPEVRNFVRQVHTSQFLNAAFVTAPADSPFIQDPRANKIHFYGIHAIELLSSVLGTQVEWVHAHRSAKGIWVSLGLSDGRHAALNLLFGISEFYHVSTSENDRVRNLVVDPYGNMYKETLKILLGPLLRGETELAPLCDAVRMIGILDSIEQSLALAKPVHLPDIKLERGIIQGINKDTNA